MPLLALLALASALFSPAPTAAAIEERHFPETGYTVRGRFLEHWLTNGGLAQQGYPLTDEFDEVSPINGKTYRVQYFERARFEHHPGNPAPHDVLLGLLGHEQYRAKYPSDRPPTNLEGHPDHCFVQTQRCVSEPFLRYWQENGGLAQQGYPLSDQFAEVNQTDGKTYQVQYFERARIEYHPEYAGTPHEVLLGLLGREQYEDRYPPLWGPTLPPLIGGQSYAHPSRAFTVGIPDGWDVEFIDGRSVRIGTPEPRATCWVQADYSPNFTLAQIDEFISRNFEDEVVAKDRVVVNGDPAYRRVSNGVAFPAASIRRVHHYFVAEGFVAQVDCAVEREAAAVYATTLDGIAGSMRIVPGGHVRDAATAPSVTADQWPVRRTTAFALGDPVYITYMVITTSPGVILDVKLYRDGAPIDLEGAATTFANPGTHRGSYAYQPNRVGEYRVEFYVAGEVHPSRALVFSVR